MKQKILVMVTLDGSIRSKVDAWDGEDGELVRQDKEIGLSGGPIIPQYKTPLHAIGDGWRLMAPPQFIKDYTDSIDAYEWWFEKS